jgi:hydrogenase maturation protease
LEAKVTLIGLGNLLMGDEGVGVHAIRYLEAHYEVPPDLEIVDGGTAGLDLLPYVEKRHRVIFVDAVNFEREPGYIGILKNREIPAMFGVKDSLHHLGLMDVLAAAQLLDATPGEMCLIGIQPQTMELGVELSDLMQGRLPALVDHILEQLRSWGFTLPPRPPEVPSS